MAKAITPSGAMHLGDPDRRQDDKMKQMSINIRHPELVSGSIFFLNDQH